MKQSFGVAVPEGSEGIGANALQGQISSQQVAVEKLKKMDEVLLDAKGSLLPAKNDIQKTLDDIIGRYDNVSSTHVMLEQDIAGHQSSINAMNEKVKKFMETTDPSTASSLQKAEEHEESQGPVGMETETINQQLNVFKVLQGEAASQAQARQQELKKEARSNKALLNALNEVTSALLELVPWRAREGLEKMVAEDNDHYHLTRDTMIQKVEEIDAALLRSQQFHDKIDQVWESLECIMELLRQLPSISAEDAQDFIWDLEDPGINHSVIKQQQEAAESKREEIDGLQEELDIVINLGYELIAACGEPDKPIVKKSIDELHSAWDSLNKDWVDKLKEAMQAAVQYQDGLQAIFEWVDIAGGKLASMSPIGTELDFVVKQQIEELKNKVSFYIPL
ncbi:Dystonin [Manis javanica]|nr:Dystonin [Manis javanica]